MPQMWLPIFPKGVTEINELLAFAQEGDNITYYHGLMPVFTHHKNDTQTFRLILSQFYINGNATQSELVKSLGIPPVTLKRSVKLYKEKGPQGFFEPPKRGGPRVLTTDTVAEVERLFEEGRDVSEISQQLGVRVDTIKKGIQQGRVKKKSPNKSIR
jgi:transposase-like protein